MDTRSVSSGRSAALGWFTVRGPYRRVLVEGSSMEPTLRPGDQVLVRVGATVRPGDVVVARLPERPLGVKRAWRRVPGGWELRGDAPELSTDSRQFGMVPDHDIVGRVLLRYWPWSPRQRGGRPGAGPPGGPRAGPRAGPPPGPPAGT